MPFTRNYLYIYALIIWNEAEVFEISKVLPNVMAITSFDCRVR